MSEAENYDVTVDYYYCTIEISTTADLTMTRNLPWYLMCYRVGHKWRSNVDHM
jgi:hypothetical protein